MDLLIQLLSRLVPKDISISENTGQLWPLKVFRPFCRVSGRKNSLWGLCTCYGPENFYDDSWYIGSNSEHLFKFSSSWIRCIKSKKLKIAINYIYLNKKFSCALYGLLPVKFDEKRFLNIVLTLKNRFQTASQDFNFQLKTQIQVLQIFQNSAGGQAQLLRSLERDYPDSSLPTESSGNHLQSSELFIKHK